MQYIFLFQFDVTILFEVWILLCISGLQNEDAPYAFVVLVENGGGGNAVAGTVAGKVLNVIVNGY